MIDFEKYFLLTYLPTLSNSNINKYNLLDNQNHVKIVGTFFTHIEYSNTYSYSTIPKYTFQIITYMKTV